MVIKTNEYYQYNIRESMIYACAKYEADIILRIFFGEKGISVQFFRSLYRSNNS